MAVILILKFELVELLNYLLDNRLLIFDLLIQLIVYSHLVNLFLDKFYHQGCVFVRTLVEHGNRMQIYSLIEDHVFYFAFGFALQHSQLIVVKKEKLELHSLIFHELNIIEPIHTLLGRHLNNRTVSLYCQAVSNEDKAIPHKNVRLLLLTNKRHRIDSHQSIGETIIDD